MPSCETNVGELESSGDGETLLIAVMSEMHTIARAVGIFLHSTRFNIRISSTG